MQSVSVHAVKGSESLFLVTGSSRNEVQTLTCHSGTNGHKVLCSDPVTRHINISLGMIPVHRPDPWGILEVSPPVVTISPLTILNNKVDALPVT